MFAALEDLSTEFNFFKPWMYVCDTVEITRAESQRWNQTRCPSDKE
jgi:hypothetical protein